jgi:hypothetical protein
MSEAPEPARALVARMIWYESAAMIESQSM